jgi:hypothetical protein
MKGRWHRQWPECVSQHDIIYLSPPADPVLGLPIGNGDLGALIWAEGSTLIVAVTDFERRVALAEAQAGIHSKSLYPETRVTDFASRLNRVVAMLCEVDSEEVPFGYADRAVGQPNPQGPFQPNQAQPLPWNDRYVRASWWTSTRTRRFRRSLGPRGIPTTKPCRSSRRR